MIGEDAFLIRGIRDKLWKLTDYHGTLGLALFGIAGIDIALWDAVGRAAWPAGLAAAWRAARPRAGLCDGWLAELRPRHIAADLRPRRWSKGFVGVKMKVGAPTLRGGCAADRGGARGDRRGSVC